MAKDLFPGWRWGPDGEARLFQSESDIPKGWVDHPSKVGKKQGGKKVETPAEDDLDL